MAKGKQAASLSALLASKEPRQFRITHDHLNKAVEWANTASSLRQDATQFCVLAQAGMDLFPDAYVVEAGTQDISAYNGDPNALGPARLIHYAMFRPEDAQKVRRIVSLFDQGAYNEIYPLLPFEAIAYVSHHNQEK